MAEVTIDWVSKRIGDTPILKDINLTVLDREFLCIIGPSGCGKTTILRIVSGLDRPSSGSVLFGGRDVTNVPPSRRDVSMVFQSYALYPHRRARGNISFPLELKHMERGEIHKKVVKTAEDLGYGLVNILDRRPAQLAVGQRQRVAIGRAVVRDPQVYLFDEPLSNLDAKIAAIARVAIKRLIREVRRTAIYVTPSVNEALALADRIAVMSNGRIEQVSTPTGIWSRPANAFVADFVHQNGLNLFRCTLDSDTRRVITDDFTFPLIPSILARSRNERRIIMGILPERLRLTQATEQSTLVGQVELVEPLVADRRKKLHIRRGNTKCIASVPINSPAGRDDWVGVEFDTESAFIFDADDGRSIY